MNDSYFLYILVMAIVTYLIRMLPIVVFQKKIHSRFLKDFLYYVPYAVLSAMTIPGVIYATGNPYTALIGFAVAIGAALLGKGLLTVAIAGCAAAFLAGLII